MGERRCAGQGEMQASCQRGVLGDVTALTRLRTPPPRVQILLVTPLSRRSEMCPSTVQGAQPARSSRQSSCLLRAGMGAGQLSSVQMQSRRESCLGSGQAGSTQLPDLPLYESECRFCSTPSVTLQVWHAHGEKENCSRPHLYVSRSPAAPCMASGLISSGVA